MAVAEQLAMQTERLRRVPWEASAWQEAARELLAARRSEPMFSAVRVCPLLGFLDNERQRVGCLAHPLTTGGVDLRDCGVYRASVCETFTCPSFGWLTDAQARLVRAACADWYLYGLVITDVEFVRGCLRLLEWELAGPARPELLMEQPETLAAVRRLLALKETAPRRGANATVFGRFNRDADGEPIPRTLDYAKLGMRAAPEDDVVLCLGYAPHTKDALDRARSIVRASVRSIALAMD